MLFQESDKYITKKKKNLLGYFQCSFLRYITLQPSNETMQHWNTNRYRKTQVRNFFVYDIYIDGV